MRNVAAVVVLEREREEIKMPNGGSFVVILEVAATVIRIKCIFMKLVSPFTKLTCRSTDGQRNPDH